MDCVLILDMHEFLDYLQERYKKYVMSRNWHRFIFAHRTIDLSRYLYLNRVDLQFYRTEEQRVIWQRGERNHYFSDAQLTEQVGEYLNQIKADECKELDTVAVTLEDLLLILSYNLYYAAHFQIFQPEKEQHIIIGKADEYVKQVELYMQRANVRDISPHVKFIDNTMWLTDHASITFASRGHLSLIREYLQRFKIIT